MRQKLKVLWAGIFVIATVTLAWSAPPPAGADDRRGPFNVTVLEGGVGLSRALGAGSALAAAGASWTIDGWVRSPARQAGAAIVAAVGDTSSGPWHGIVLADGVPELVLGARVAVRATTALVPGQWHFVAASYDGHVATLILDGAGAQAAVDPSAAVAAQIDVAPAGSDAVPQRPHFGGDVAGLMFEAHALSAGDAKKRAALRPDFSVVTFNQLGVGWPFQEHAWRGLQEPQDPWTLPQAHAHAGVPQAQPVTTSPALQPRAPHVWTLDAWRLRAAPGISAAGEQLSQPGFDDSDWYAAVVPGTVLTTLIDRGVYADPDYGLNNLTIPDALSRQDYWYRTTFMAPAAGARFTLTFKGINYAAEVYLNGVRLGSIKGAFTRGVFDVSAVLRTGSVNVLAVKIAPPPHPGIPHEQSVAAGPGQNGGNLALDGPTFIASEGWDWIPGIRDRNTGIWQAVELRATQELEILDPHVVTHLPLPRTDAADVTIAVPLQNRAAATVNAVLTARFGDVSVRKEMMVAPGISEITLTPAEFPQLHLDAPQLWWPNGYGAAYLYTLRLEVEAAGRQSDARELKFGIRELSYELSLFNHAGQLRRVTVDPAAAEAPLVDTRHQAIKRTPNGWAQSLTAAGETSRAVTAVDSTSLSPYLTIRVNGVPIAARGGSWGTDDSRKRISVAHLRPYFELHRAANLNIIRNWLGQNTEDVFYDLADEYGLLVLNDFWESTQDFQLEAEDPALFLANARDVVARYRNHPSIAVWFGRNEGVPQPIINAGLDHLIAALDGTRLYMGSSNMVNLQASGPYDYRPPADYFSKLGRGFAVELGTPSLATLESLRASIPAEDRWPIGDTYAYHDWHFGGNGDVASFMSAMALELGAPTSLEDFERKAQLMDYESYRAIFEGFQADLWTKNSGRLLWMTHPSWPSNTWQIYSSDYDTAAAYYAVKKACEPVHAQFNAADFSVAVVNIGGAVRDGLTLHSQIVSLDNRTLAERSERLSAAANATVTLAPLDLAQAFAHEPVVLIKLTLNDAKGTVLSQNLYWQAADRAALRGLGTLAAQPVMVTATRDPALGAVSVTVVNRGRQAALNTKLTVLDRHGTRVLPAFYDDNYLSLLPGESRKIEVRCPAAPACETVAVRGWNVEPRSSRIRGAARRRGQDADAAGVLRANAPKRKMPP